MRTQVMRRRGTGDKARRGDKIDALLVSGYAAPVGEGGFGNEVNRMCILFKRALGCCDEMRGDRCFGNEDTVCVVF